MEEVKLPKISKGAMVAIGVLAVAGIAVFAYVSLSSSSASASASASAATRSLTGATSAASTRIVGTNSDGSPIYGTGSEKR